MKKLILLLLGIGSLVSLEIGDTFNFYLDHFMLMFSRDSVPRLGVVKEVGDNSYVATIGERIRCNRLSNWYDTVLLTSTLHFPDQEPLYFYKSYDGTHWESYSAIAGIDTFNGETDMDIYDYVYFEPEGSSGLMAIMFVATTDGLVRSGLKLNPASGVPSSFYRVDIDINPLSIGVLSKGTLALPRILDIILLVGTDQGVYRVIVDTVSTTEFVYHYSQEGATDTFSVYTIGINPADTSIRFIGTDKGLWKWNGSDWEIVSDISDVKVNEVYFDATHNYWWILTEQGAYYSTDNGSSWTEISGLSGKNCLSVYVDNSGNVYVGTYGEGIFKSSISNLSSWTELNEGLTAWASLGALNVFSFEEFKGSLYCSNDQGVFKYNPSENKWVSSAGGIGSFVPDEDIIAVKEAFENPLGDNVSVKEIILNFIKDTLGISWVEDSLTDSDNDPKIFLIISSITQSANLGEIQPHLLPILGYFDPYHSDLSIPESLSSSHHEMIVIDIDRVKTNNVNLAHLLGYLYAKYALWSLNKYLDDNRYNQKLLTSLAMWITQRAFGDTQLIYGILSDKALGSDVNVINSPVLDYVTAYLNSHVARESDREKGYVWIEYLYRKYGLDILRDIILRVAPDNYGYSFLKNEITSYGGSFEEDLIDWAYKIYNGDLGYHIETSLITPIEDIASESNIVTLTYYGGFRIFESTGGGPVVFNSTDGYKGLKINVIDPENNNIISYYDSTNLDEFGRFYEYLDTSESRVYIVVNFLDDYAKFIFSKDTSSPQVYGLFFIQNPALSRYGDFYLITQEYIYSDVGDQFGEVKVNYFDTSYADTSVCIMGGYYPGGDSFKIWWGSFEFAGFGDVELTYIVQDLAGNDAIYEGNKLPIVDTMSILRVDNGGGKFVALGGKVVLVVPENAISYDAPILINSMPEDAFCKIFTSGSNDKLGLSEVYSIGSSNIVFNKSVELWIKDAVVSKYPDEVSLYRWTGNGWEKVENCWVENGVLKAKLQKLGIFQIRKGGSVYPRKFALNFSKGNVVRNGILTIKYGVPVLGEVALSIYDLSGRKVATIFKGEKVPGYYEISWKVPSKVSSGVYFITLEKGKELKIKRRFVILK